MRLERQYCRHSTSRAVVLTLEHEGWKERVTRQLLVPCGKCEYCRRQAQNEWSSRLYKHAVRHHKKYAEDGRIFFCTLTISNEWFIKHYRECEPMLRDDMPNFVFTGDIDDIQHTGVAKHIYSRYVKAKLLDILRSPKGAGLDLEYYVACEFGDQTERIHYHLILYIKNFSAVRNYCKNHGLRPKRPWYVKGANLSSGDRRLATMEERYMETCLDYMWSDFDNRSKKRMPIGHTNVNLACAKSFRYITKYVCKIEKDIDARKEPFHRQSRMLGIDEDEICVALLNNKRYVDIQGSSKTYKLRISKYYVDKFARLLGIKNDLTQDFIDKSRELVREQENVLNEIYDDTLEHHGTFVHLKNDDLVTIEVGHRELVDTQTRVKVCEDGKTHYIWRTIQRLIWFIDNQTTYLNNQIYVPKDTEAGQSEPCETY